MKARWLAAVGFWLVFAWALASAYGKIVDIILISVSVTGLAVLTLYKLMLWFRYRHDPAKREWLTSAGQI